MTLVTSLQILSQGPNNEVLLTEVLGAALPTGSTASMDACTGNMVEWPNGLKEEMQLPSKEAHRAMFIRCEDDYIQFQKRTGY